MKSMAALLLLVPFALADNPSAFKVEPGFVIVRKHLVWNDSILGPVAPVIPPKPAPKVEPVKEPIEDDPLCGQGPWLPVGEQLRVRRLLPRGLLLPRLRFYQRTSYSQRAVNYVREGDWLTAHHVTKDDYGTENPNGKFPWAAPGGMHDMVGWKAEVGAYVPGKIKVWKERVYSQSQISGLPMVRWEYPEGTVFTEVLSHQGKPFEVRKAEKRNGKWDRRVEFKDMAAAPPGYKGLTKTCAECHDRAGDAVQYGIALRGNDGVFSAPILKEGTVSPDSDHWPLEWAAQLPIQRVDQNQRVGPVESGLIVPQQQFQRRVIRRGRS